VVTLQNPHGLPSASVNNVPAKADTQAEATKTVAKKTAATVVQAKAAEPCRGQAASLLLVAECTCLQGTFRLTRVECPGHLSLRLLWTLKQRPRSFCGMR
jgi:hypothetical protein